MTHPATQAALDILQQLHKEDPISAERLMSFRVRTTLGVVQHPHIVTDVDDTNSDTVGSLGIINGILDRMGAEKVAMIINDESSAVEGFKVYAPS